NYFLTMAPDALSTGTAGWFPALNPTVLLDTGVSEGASFIASAAASYPPASAFAVYPFAMNFTVTGTAVPIPEPVTASLIAFGALLALLSRRIGRHNRSGPAEGGDRAL